MSVHLATEADASDWAQLRHELWPSGSLSEHEADIAALLAKPDETLNLIAVSEDGMAIGFAETSWRHDYVNGCNSSPVAFLEGIRAFEPRIIELVDVEWIARIIWASQ